MVSDNDISYAESLVRRALEAIALKKESGTPEELTKLQEDLKLRERDLQDLKSRKRKAEDQAVREKTQKDMDERRKRFA